ncbi:MAG: amidohydrolase family protein [Acidobacteriota bacterium]
MNDLPIFDSLVHPTLDGRWLVPEAPPVCRIEDLIGAMRAHDIRWALAAGMEGIGSYSEGAYIEMINRYPDILFPIAFYPAHRITSRQAVREWVRRVKSLGYRGVKVHPRLSDLALSDPLLPELASSCSEAEMTFMLCTYFYSSRPGGSRNTIDALGAFLESIGDARIILLHGGSVRLLETIELARAFTNVLLDLSFTLCKYEGSSIDHDLRYAFESFDRRICIGSDHPNFSLQDLRRRFEQFSAGLDREKRHNIAHRNMLHFMGVEDACR